MLSRKGGLNTAHRPRQSGLFLMTENIKTVEDLLSELSMIEMESQRLLDDESCRVVAEADNRGLLTDDEWTRIKQLLLEALAFLSSPQKSSTNIIGGKVAIDPDTDPRNADWLRIDAAHLLSGHLLPTDRVFGTHKDNGH